MKNRYAPKTARPSFARTLAWVLPLLALVPQVRGQYCSAGASTPGAAGITQVVFNTINNSSSSSPAYTDFTSISTSVLKGSTYNLSVKINATGLFTTNTALAWIDWNQNNVFDASEQYALGTVTTLFSNVEALTSSSPLAITIPLTAIAGNTRMRVRMQRGGAPSACGNTNNSEAEDYTITVVAPPICSGTPVPGNTTTSNATPCPGSNFTLGIQFPSTDLGLTYQWESSTAGAGGPFANNGLGTAATQATNTTVPKWYRVRVTCSGNTGISTPVAITPVLSGACYCAPTASTDDNTGLTNVTFGSINNSSTGAPPYSDYSAISTSVYQGSVHALSVRVNTAGNYTVYVKAWIDWNQNGTFDAGEEYNLGTATNVADGAPSGSPLVVTAPFTALPGTTVMRVRATYNVAATACGNQDYSEAEDYSVLVLLTPPCTGTPAPGNTTANMVNPCPGANFTLGIDNPVPGAGLTYQWQSSTAGAGGPFANNGLGTAPSQITSASVPTWYRVSVTCSGNTGYSTPKLITPTLSVACYCTPTATTDDNTGLTYVAINSIANTSTGTGAYANYSGLSTTVEKGRSYPLSVRVNTAGNFTVNAMAWIDWDHSGTFDAGETYTLGSATNVANGATSASPLSIAIPMTAATGPTIMRVRARYNSAPTPCGNNNYSEAEDYTLNVQPQHNTCATALAVTCGNTYESNTTGVPVSMPPTACPFNGPPSTGGQNWWLYSAAANEQVMLSTCGLAAFNTRISVFSGSDCNNLACVALSDDSPGCPGGTSFASFNSVAGTSYWIAVHGAGAAEGMYSLSVNCAAVCAPPANDACTNAIALANTLADGNGSPATYTNTCATGDAPTTCSGAMPVQGVWFSFNSGNYNRALITLQDNGENPTFTASILNYALYTGACGGLGASGSVACAMDAAGINQVSVTPNTNYLLLVYNNGGANVAGTFGLRVQHPAGNDASITAILAPAPGLYCAATLVPQVTLRNNGDNNLTSAVITYGLSGGGNNTYTWTGNLAYGASVDLTLPAITTVPGFGQTLSVAASMPNGVADEFPANDTKTLGPVNVGGEGVVVNIYTDNNASGLSWQIYDEAFNVVAANGTLGNNMLVSEHHCLATDNGNCFQLYLADTYGDGLCCANGNGYWELRLPNGGLLLRDLFASTVDGYSSPTSNPLTPTYGFGHSFCLPAGPANIALNECGIFDNLLGNKVYCNKVTGANQYQFEFSDPDAGFLRRITVSTNYVIFSHMATVPLTPGVKYFARVRSNVAGPLLSAHFGTGCEMGLSTAVVGCSQLIQAPAYGHSCNETRTFNTNNSFIYAKPVLGATEYQFRIFNLGEGYDQTFSRNTYILQLKWNANVAPGLTVGSTFNVEINVKVNGVYSGFCPSSCAITIVGSTPGGRPEAMLAEAQGQATLWPNPVRDGQVHLSIDGLADAQQKITVDILDLYGKQVFAHEFGNSGERFTTLLDLPSTVASGVYMVNITVNGKTTVQRLSIIK